jgi:hypothetical protein
MAAILSSPFFRARRRHGQGRGGTQVLRRRTLAAILVLITNVGGLPLPAQTVCDKADFEAVVDQAAAALRELNAKNKPAFQEKLRQLKARRGWTHDQFLTLAAPLVQDEKIAEFDQQSADFLDNINSLGSEGAGAATPDCALLREVRSNMTGLVEAQEAKWAYMFEKIEGELTR